MKEKAFLKNKKLEIILAIILLFMLFGMTKVYATENIPTYTISIPATITVGNSGWNEFSGGIRATGSNFRETQTLSVTANSEHNWSLVSEHSTDTIGYNLVSSNTSTYSSSATPATWEFSKSELEATNGTTKTAGIVVEDYSNKKPGNYENTVTFTVSVISTSYTVTFKDGETTLSTATVEDGQTVTKPADPTKDGFEFVNWYSDSELTNLFDFTSTVTGDTTIYAKWTEVATKTTIARLITSDSQYGMETNYQVTVNNVTLGNKVENNSETYMTQNLNVWKVFYKDTNEDVYLIYGDYLPAKCVPQEAKAAGLQEYTVDTSRPYAVYGGNVGSTDKAKRDAAVSSLGTASYWNGSFGKTLQGKSITATGAPTKEQFHASYGSESTSGLDNTNTLYFPHNANYQTCSGYWLASAHPDYEYATWTVVKDGRLIYNRSGNTTFAARPVICLPFGITGTITDGKLNIDAE